MKTRRKSDCCASIKSEKLNNFVEQVSDHTDPSSATKCETMKVKTNFKRRACDSLDNPRKIINTEVQNVSEAVAVNLPWLDHLGKTITATEQTPSS